MSHTYTVISTVYLTLQPMSNAALGLDIIMSYNPSSIVETSPGQALN